MKTTSKIIKLKKNMTWKKQQTDKEVYALICVDLSHCTEWNNSIISIVLVINTFVKNFCFLVGNMVAQSNLLHIFIYNIVINNTVHGNQDKNIHFLIEKVKVIIRTFVFKLCSEVWLLHIPWLLFDLGKRSSEYLLYTIIQWILFHYAYLF